MRARRPGLRRTAAALIAAGIVVESWIRPLPTSEPPAALTITDAVPDDAVILELPLGLIEDVAAMYRSIHHGRQVVNGMSGFDPPHYVMFRVAMDEQRYEALDAIASYAPIAIFIPHRNAGTVSAALRSRSKAQPLATTPAHEVWLWPKGPSPLTDAPGGGAPIAVQQLDSPIERETLTMMLDGRSDTVWFTDRPQDGTEFFVADLGEPDEIDAVVLGQGASRVDFPRAIAIDLSADGVEWSETWRGETAAMTIAAAIADPREVRVTFDIGARRARYVRVRQIGKSPVAWGVAEFRVLGR